MSRLDSHNPPVLILQEPWLHSACEAATEWLLYFMVVFGPWAFGTTELWSTRVMDAAGYLLGGLMALKWITRRTTGWHRAVCGRDEDPGLGTLRGWGARRPSYALAGLTVLILAYCLVSLLNARATYVRSEYRFDYHPCLNWLPHSYDATSTWSAFVDFLALAMVFWAARDWLLGGDQSERFEGKEERSPASRSRGVLLPSRLKRLLWVICVNGALLALEGLIQRTSGTSKLLWWREPRINRDPEAQFGPYAYRSNAAQYFTLIWPVTLGFWWLLHRSSKHQRRPRSAHHRLLPCVMLVAACPLISLSRAGAVVGIAGIVVAVGILLLAPRDTGWRPKLGLVFLLAAVLGLGWYVGWVDLSKRFEGSELDPERIELWRTGLQMARDFPIFGTGPGTFEPVYQLYRGSPDDYWPAQLHNDWLETLITFGRVGFGMILLALGLVFGRWFVRGGIPSHRVFVMYLWLALGGCLAHAAVDFPFQIYSILFLFLLLCAILSCLSRKA